MRKWLFVLILLGLAALTLPMTVGAFGLDVEAKAGAGIGLGTTDNKNITGAARLAAGGGVGIDLFLLNAGPVTLGLSTGVEYSYLTFHSTDSNYQGYGLNVTTDATYNYITVPIALVGSMPLSSSLRLVMRAGAFIGYFLNGSADLTGDVVQTSDLDSSNTEQWQYGLHFTAGADIDLGGNFSVSPALQFDMGLTDTSVNAVAGPYKDTFWSLTAIVGIKYKAM